MVASLPNVRHHSVVSSLLEGNWSYEPAGLLDETHLRFFTRRDMVDLFQQAGFEVANVQIVPGPGYEEWRRSGCPGEVRVGRLHIADTPPEEAEEFFVYQYLMVARPRTGQTNGTRESNGFKISHHRGARSALATRGMPLSAQNESLPVETRSGAQQTNKPRIAGRALRISFLGNFDQDWSTEGYAADALEHLGHTVSRIHEYGVQSESDVIARIRDFQADCLVFFKGRIGVDPRNSSAVLCPDPSRLIQLIRRSPVPAYLWYYDRVHDYDAEPARLEWMRQVAPLCRIAFVTDAGLTSANWANWRVLRQGISRPTVTGIQVPENERHDLAFVGQIYGERHQELAPLQRAYKVKVISQVFGRDLSALIRRQRIIIGPRYPSAPGYWSDRIYVVLGHGGFFLAPEVEGMRDEGFVPGVHYASVGDDAVCDVRYWLSQPEQRERIAREGQALVLSRFTYEDRVRILCDAIAGD